VREGLRRADELGAPLAHDAERRGKVVYPPPFDSVT
jgi:hypothetical protein